MKIAGIVCEYDPFHSGHQTHIEETRKAGFSHIAAVMSPNFTQRGGFAALEKRVRVRAALQNGIDLVIELPVAYAVSPAERFAMGAVSILDSLGVVDAVSFGSESGDIPAMRALCEIMDSPGFKPTIASSLKTGVSYPRAVSQAAERLSSGALSGILQNPNDMLGVEYIRAMGKLVSKMEPMAILRTGAGHNGAIPGGGIASASYIRALMKEDFDSIKPYVPESAFALYAENRAFFARPERLEAAFLYRLRTMAKADFAALPDMSEGLDNLLRNAAAKAGSMEKFFALAKTKRYTLARIRRAALAALLGIDNNCYEYLPPYVRVLGFNEAGKEILSRMKQTCRLPVSQSLAALSRLGPREKQFAETESRASDIFALSLDEPLALGYDYTVPVVKG